MCQCSQHLGAFEDTFLGAKTIVNLPLYIYYSSSPLTIQCGSMPSVKCKMAHTLQKIGDHSFMACNTNIHNINDQAIT